MRLFLCGNAKAAHICEVKHFVLPCVFRGLGWRVSVGVASGSRDDVASM